MYFNMFEFSLKQGGYQPVACLLLFVEGVGVVGKSLLILMFKVRLFIVNSGSL